MDRGSSHLSTGIGSRGLGTVMRSGVVSAAAQRLHGIDDGENGEENPGDKVRTVDDTRSTANAIKDVP